MDKASPFFFFPAGWVFSLPVVVGAVEEIVAAFPIGLEGFLLGMGDTSEGCFVMVVLEVVGRN